MSVDYYPASLEIEEIAARSVSDGSFLPVDRIPVIEPRAYAWGCYWELANDGLAGYYCRMGYANNGRQTGFRTRDFGSCTSVAPHDRPTPKPTSMAVSPA